MFLYNGLYVHIKLVLGKTNTHKKAFFFSQRKHTPVKRDPPFVSLIVSVCICFIQNRLSNNIWVVQFLRFKLVDYFHKQFVYEKKPESYPIHSITQFDRSLLKKKKKKRREVGSCLRDPYICRNRALVAYTDNMCNLPPLISLYSNIE